LFCLQSTKTIVQEQKFGFRCLISLVDEICELGVTCDQKGQRIYRRQAEELYQSDAPPTCGVFENPNGCEDGLSSYRGSGFGLKR